MSSEPAVRAAFLDALGEAYNLRRKSLLLLTGAVHDLFPGADGFPGADRGFVGLEQALVHALADRFLPVRLDLAGGVGFYDRGSEQALKELVGPKAEELLEAARHRPLAGLTLLRDLLAGTGGDRRPVLIIMPFAGALFPAGEPSRMSELDRQRLVLFLQWINDPAFAQGADLVLLIHPVRSELNTQLLTLPAADHLEIPLPDRGQRRRFVDHFCGQRPDFDFADPEPFCRATAGLPLTALREMLEVAVRTGQAPGRAQVIARVNRLLEAELGDIVRVRDPRHGPDDIVGYEQTGALFQRVFERCEEPDTAVPAILISGPNGAGKTFQLEAWASASGRSVVELSGIRGSLFGETDRFFERLRWHLETLGKILILVDEAHTAFGSVHSADTHGTEKRLAGNLIKLMSDSRFLGKVLWALMTSRPDALDPDIKSRAPIQVPIFDLEGPERREFVTRLFERKKIALSTADLDRVLATTDYYSARDYSYLVSETLAVRRRHPDTSIAQVLEGWQASRAIEGERERQAAIAARHCSDRRLLPARFRDPADPGA